MQPGKKNNCLLHLKVNVKTQAIISDTFIMPRLFSDWLIGTQLFYYGSELVSFPKHLGENHQDVSSLDSNQEVKRLNKLHLKAV